MSMSDPIADMLTRIRNCARSGHAETTSPGSKQKLAILNILKREGFIENYDVDRKGLKTDIRVRLKYSGKRPVIRQLERASRPGRRYYVRAKDLRPVRNNMGVSIISTSQGIMTGRKAKKLNIGGEVICRVW